MSKPKDKTEFGPTAEDGAGWVAHHIPFSTLAITAEGVTRAMGYGDTAPPGPVVETLEALLAETKDHCSIQAGYRVLADEAVAVERDSVQLGDVRFRTGPIIAAPLRRATSIAVFVATAGPGMDEWRSTYFDAGDVMEGYLVDAIGSETVERGADALEAALEGLAIEREQGATHRYSPGYCGWDVREQHKLFSLLPPSVCGITLADSALMRPAKSVSGIIGFGARVAKSAYPCDVCDFRDCYRRNTRYL